MSKLSITINDNQIQFLKKIADNEGKSLSVVVSELIDEFIKNQTVRSAAVEEKDVSYGAMKISEEAFSEWNNEEDEIYDEL